MSPITVLEDRIKQELKSEWLIHILVQKALIDKYFPWINCEVVGKILIGNGVIRIAGVSYLVKIMYSPFLLNRLERIYIKVAGKNIEYHKDIHVYKDLSLCLYHPYFDRQLFKTIPLISMLPWISEWCVFYQEWKRYGVWLGKEIKH